jgi:hypothetical protein
MPPHVKMSIKHDMEELFLNFIYSWGIKINSNNNDWYPDIPGRCNRCWKWRTAVYHVMFTKHVSFYNERKQYVSLCDKGEITDKVNV